MNRRTRISIIAAVMLTVTLATFATKYWTSIVSWYQRKLYDDSIRNRLPIKDAQEIEIAAITSIYTIRGYHLYANNPVCISVGYEKLSKKQLDFLKEIHPQTFSYDNCPKDTSDRWPGNVHIYIGGSKKLKSDSILVQWNYVCGSLCAMSGEFQFSKFNGKWMITRYKPGPVS